MRLCFVKNTATGFSRTLKTTGEGTFQAPVLPPGNYTVHVEANSFSTLEQTNVIVTVGSTTTLRLKMELGALSETVTVESTVQLDTTKTSESSLVDFRQIQDLPINGRRADQFALLHLGSCRESNRFGRRWR